MFKKNNLYIFCCIFILNACNNKDPQITFKDSDFTTKNNTLLEVIIPVASGEKNIIDNINSVISKEAIKALHTGDSESITSKSIEESINTFNDEYSKFNVDFPESSQPWEAQIDGEIMHQSPEIISMSLTSYINTGGAHGNLIISFLNFDTKTGKQIENKSLFKNVEDFKKIAKNYFEDAIENKDTLFDPQSFVLPENIGYNEEGVILLYNAYEIGPYSTGIIEFTIPFEKVDSFLNFNSL